jgi:hypothetical protein
VATNVPFAFLYPATYTVPVSPDSGSSLPHDTAIAANAAISNTFALILKNFLMLFINLIFNCIMIV